MRSLSAPVRGMLITLAMVCIAILSMWYHGWPDHSWVAVGLITYAFSGMSLCEGDTIGMPKDRFFTLQRIVFTLRVGVLSFVTAIVLTWPSHSMIVPIFTAFGAMIGSLFFGRGRNDKHPVTEQFVKAEQLWKGDEFGWYQKAWPFLVVFLWGMFVIRSTQSPQGLQDVWLQLFILTVIFLGNPLFYSPNLSALYRAPWITLRVIHGVAIFSTLFAAIKAMG